MLNTQFAVFMDTPKGSELRCRNVTLQQAMDERDRINCHLADRGIPGHVASASYRALTW